MASLNYATKSLSFLLAFAFLALAGCLQQQYPSTETAPGAVTCHDNLDTENAEYYMTGNCLSSASNAFNVTATNVTLDCRGFYITTTDDYRSIYSTMNQTKIRNCNILASGGTTAAYPIYFVGSNFSSIRNTTITGSTSSYNIYFSLSSDGEVVDVITSSAGGIGLILQSGSSRNNISNFSISGGHASWGAVLLDLNNVGNLFRNGTVSGLGKTSTTKGAIKFNQAGNTGNSFINITLVNTSTLVYIPSTINNGNNTFCLNNFSNIGSGTGPPTYFVTDLNKSNYYNCTYDGKNQGNAWGDIINGTIEVTGTVASSIAGLYIGNAGAGVPYTYAISNKFNCNFAGCADYAPLTPTYIPGDINVMTTLIAPANNTILTTSFHTFTWKCSGGNASYYANLSINNTVNLTNIISMDSVATSGVVSGLQDEKSYNWNVTCVNESKTNTSDTWIFNISIAPTLIVTQDLPRLLFFPANRNSQSVSTFGQNSTRGIFNLTATGTYNAIISCGTPACVTLKCAPNWNQTGLATCFSYPTLFQTMTDGQNSTVWCWADFNNCMSISGKINVTVE